MNLTVEGLIKDRINEFEINLERKMELRLKIQIGKIKKSFKKKLNIQMKKIFELEDINNEIKEKLKENFDLNFVNLNKATFYFDDEIKIQEKQFLEKINNQRKKINNLENKIEDINKINKDLNKKLSENLKKKKN